MNIQRKHIIHTQKKREKKASNSHYYNVWQIDKISNHINFLFTVLQPPETAEALASISHSFFTLPYLPT